MQKFVIWGTGNYGEQAYEFISNQNEQYAISKVYDSANNRIGKEFHGFIIHDSINIKLEDNESVLLCSNNWESMIESLHQQMISERKVFCWNDGIMKLSDIYSVVIHSQDGEELYLKDKFANVQIGRYVDVGACHPIRFNNTLWAYEKGWRGINIEPNPDYVSLYKYLRANDININCGIANKKDVLKYYQFDEPCFNTFDERRANHLEQELNIKVRKIEEVPVVTLKSIFEENRISYVDFIDIDVEERELDVLESIDFDKVQFGCIMVEQLGMTLEEVVNSDVARLLNKQDYVAVAKFDRTVVYEKR